MWYPVIAYNNPSPTTPLRYCIPKPQLEILRATITCASCFLPHTSLRPSGAARPPIRSPQDAVTAQRNVALIHRKGPWRHRARGRTAFYAPAASARARRHKKSRPAFEARCAAVQHQRAHRGRPGAGRSRTAGQSTRSRRNSPSKCSVALGGSQQAARVPHPRSRTICTRCRGSKQRAHGHRLQSPYLPPAKAVAGDMAVPACGGTLSQRRPPHAGAAPRTCCECSGSSCCCCCVAGAAASA